MSLSSPLMHYAASLRRLLPSRALPAVLVVPVLLLSCSRPPAGEVEACSDIECSAGRCVLEGGEPTCRCGALEVAQGLTCVVSKRFNIDDYGDEVEEATPLTLPVSGKRAVFDDKHGSMPDRDVFSFEASGGRIYTLSCAPERASSCRIVVFGPQGERLAEADGAPAHLALELAQGGRYTVSFEGPGSGGPYAFDILDSGTDDHGDTPAAATRVEVGPQAITGMLETLGDVDVLALPVFAGRTYRVTYTRGTLTAEGLEVQGPDAVPFATSAEEGSTRQLTGEADRDGFLLVIVSSYSRWYSTPRVGSYSLRFEDLGPDDHGDSVATATDLALETEVSAVLPYAGDVDVFAVAGQAGVFYEAACRSSTSTPCRIRWLESDGTERARGEGLLREEITQEGRFFLAISPGSSPAGYVLGDYTVVVRSLGPDDHGDTVDTATLVAFDELVPGSCQADEDVDAFSFDVSDEDILRVSCTPIAPATSCIVTTYKPSHPPDVIGPDQYRGNPALYELAPAQSARVTVWVVGTSRYTLQVERIGIDDHGDAPEGATPAQVGEVVRGELFPLSDQDVFAYTLEAGTQYFVAYSPWEYLVSVHGPDGQAIPLTWGFTPGVTETYYVYVDRAYWSTIGTGPYTLTVSR